MPISNRQYDAIVIGSGPNGLGAAVTIAQAGKSVLVIEGQQTIGGGMASAELTLPGFAHDVCSAVHPMAVATPFFKTLPLEKHGLEWIDPPVACAHPLDDGTAALAVRSVEATAASLGADRDHYLRLMQPLIADWQKLVPLFFGPPLQFPSHPFAASRFGLLSMRSAAGLARSTFQGERARGLFAGMAAHSILPLEDLPTAALGLVFCLTVHVAGWPIPRGGSQSIADALASYLRSLGGEIVTGTFVRSLDELPPSRAIFCDVTPRQLAQMAGGRLPANSRRSLESFEYGPGVCKVDWALDGPIPWTVPECAQAGTVHLGATLDEVCASERAPWEGKIEDRPFVLLSQPTQFDPSRAPAGKHIGWAYCHVPNGSNLDVSDKIEQQVERFAPGFRARILKRSVRVASELERYNPNLIGGDITGGAANLKQLFLRAWRNYRTPAKGVYLCSASTWPGGGVHGLCGHYAARAALHDLF